MAKIVLTADEIVSYLKKSNLINVLVEGPDDLMIYNWIEEKMNNFNIKILPCGGRSTLIEVYKRRSEFSDKKVTYIADKDLFVFSGVPSEYSEIVFTTGYSIENDLYDYGKKVIDNLFTERECISFHSLINNLLPWYCSEVLKFLQGEEHHISFHLNRIISEDTVELNFEYIESIKKIEPSENMIDEVKENNFLKLRGKFIFDGIVRYLSHKSRRSKFSKDNIMEICLKMERNLHFDRIIEEVYMQIA